jgi:hypothetical protein
LTLGLIGHYRTAIAKTNLFNRHLQGITSANDIRTHYLPPSKAKRPRLQSGTRIASLLGIMGRFA